MSNPANNTPAGDGDVLPYLPIKPARAGAVKFYYVNGILTNPPAHRSIAELVANITESKVTGIYNASNGALSDLSQCVGDWVHIVKAQVGEEGFLRDRLTQSVIDLFAKIHTPTNIASPYLHAMRDAYIAPNEIQAKAKSVEKIRKSLKRNLAALSLFDELSASLSMRQIIVAHSQGNLITSFALWALQAVYGSQGLNNIQVRSVSSPSPAWPRGINHRIKVYGQRDDMVTLFDPKNWTGNRSAGFWENYFPKHPKKFIKSGGIAAHDVKYNIEQTTLYRRLRSDAGIAPF